MPFKIEPKTSRPGPPPPGFAAGFDGPALGFGFLVRTASPVCFSRSLAEDFACDPPAAVAPPPPSGPVDRFDDCNDFSEALDECSWRGLSRDLPYEPPWP